MVYIQLILSPANECIFVAIYNILCDEIFRTYLYRKCEEIVNHLFNLRKIPTLFDNCRWLWAWETFHSVRKYRATYQTWTKIVCKYFKAFHRMEIITKNGYEWFFQILCSAIVQDLFHSKYKLCGVNEKSS